MIRKADYDKAHAEISDEQAEAIVRDLFDGDPELAAEMLADMRPIDGAPTDDELPCADAPTGYRHIDGSEASPWSGPGIALLIVFCGTVWLILKEVVQ